MDLFLRTAGNETAATKVPDEMELAPVSWYHGDASPHRLF